MALIVSLTAIPARFEALGQTLGAILAQDHPADEVRLNIPRHYRRFPDWDGRLPEVPDGVTIHRPAEDYGPATKILPTARACAGRDVQILFGDDDRLYPPDWTRAFLNAAAAHPGCAIAHRGLFAQSYGGAETLKPQPRARRRDARTDWRFRAYRAWRRLTRGRDVRPPERRLFGRSGFVDMFEGCSGVLVQPEMFGPEAFDIPDVAWPHDDVWLSACLAHRGVPIWLEADRYTPENTRARDAAPLSETAFHGMGRGALTRAVVAECQKRLGVWT